MEGKSPFRKKRCIVSGVLGFFHGGQFQPPLPHPLFNIDSGADCSQGSKWLMRIQETLCLVYCVGGGRDREVLGRVLSVFVTVSPTSQCPQPRGTVRVGC